MDIDVRITDIETLACMFLYGDLDPATDVYTTFEISRRKNELYALVKYLRDRKWEYMVSFNGVNFDAQVLEFILRNYEKWIDLSAEEIVTLIYKFSQKVIDDTNYGLFPPFRESELSIKQIDLYRILHFNNRARMCSLKWISFSIDSPNIEEMPHHHSSKYLTDEQMDEVISYWRNDVKVTKMLLKYVLGEIESEFYNSNKVQDRFDIIKEFDFPPETLSFSDVKIGDELNKRGYAQEKGIDVGYIYEIKKQRKPTPKFTFGDCIPDYINFKTDKFKSLLRQVYKERVHLQKGKKTQEFELEHNGTKYTIAKGGIHSNEGKRIVIPNDDELLIDSDVGSQYPNAIFKRKLYPSHLGPEWLINYGKTINRRLEYKEKGLKGLAEGFKLALNGGGFGKTNEEGSWQYDPFVTFACTIGNQFEILMLIEDLELNGIRVISANTDGIVCLLGKHLEDKYYEICHEWERKVGNHEMGKLEYTYYTKIVQTSVNDYLAIKADGKVKKKGDFATDMELHKNKSRRIIPIVLEKYFVDGIPVEKTILKHKNIFDFCIGVKASRDYHYELVDPKTGQKEVFHRLVRYYVSKKGKKLLKIKNPDSEADGNQVSECEAPDKLSGYAPMCKVYNIHDPESIHHIDYDYYIKKAQEIIDSIELKKSKKKFINKNQINLF